MAALLTDEKRRRKKVHDARKSKCTVFSQKVTYLAAF